MIHKSACAFLFLPLMIGIGEGLVSCSSTSLDDLPIQVQRTLCEVTITCDGLDICTTPTRATPSEAGITHIALKAFNADGSEAASVSQTSAISGTDFNNLKLQLPAGTYTFVVVAHDASADNIPCATITSPTEAILPEGIVPTLYSHVEEITIENANNQSVTLDMGTRINATLHLTSSDIIPDGVSKIAFDINPTGTFVGNETPAKFNPTTGLTIAQPRYRRALDVTSGETIDVSFNILIPADPYSSKVVIEALDNANKAISYYTRTFDAVPFQCAYITNANGTFFRYVNNSSLTFDTALGNKEFDY